MLLLLLLSHFSRVRLCATPQMAAHQAPPSLGFSRQEYWSRGPLPSPMHESEKRKGSHSVMSDPQRPHGLQSTRLLCPWEFPGKSTGVACHSLDLPKSRVGSRDLSVQTSFGRCKSRCVRMREKEGRQGKWGQYKVVCYQAW